MCISYSKSVRFDNFSIVYFEWETVYVIHNWAGKTFKEIGLSHLAILVIFAIKKMIKIGNSLKYLGIWEISKCLGIWQIPSNTLEFGEFLKCLEIWEIHPNTWESGKFPKIHENLRNFPNAWESGKFFKIPGNLGISPNTSKSLRFIFLFFMKSLEIAHSMYYVVYCLKGYLTHHARHFKMISDM